MGSQEENYGVEARHGWEPGCCVQGQVLEQQYWLKPCCHCLRGCSRCRLGLGQQQLSGLPRWVSMRGLSRPGWHWVPPLL